MAGQPGVPQTAEDADVELRRQRLHERVERDFTYHSPTSERGATHALIRDGARRLAHHLVDHVPPGRELSTALTKLEECVMHANAGVARNG